MSCGTMVIIDQRYIGVGRRRLYEIEHVHLGIVHVIGHARTLRECREYLRVAPPGRYRVARVSREVVYDRILKKATK